MNAKDAIKRTMDLAQMTASAYLDGLSDEDLLLRPVEGMNPIAWQLGHLISSEQQMISATGHTMPELPAGFAEAHSTEVAKSGSFSQVATKDEYIALWEKTRAATKAALDATPMADLDKPGPESMKEIAPTVGALFVLAGMHGMMHAGQFVAVRRKLGKPNAI